MHIPSSSGARVAESVKARVRRASLLSAEDFKLFLEQTSVGDVAVRLGQTSYASILKGFTLTDMRRSDLEFLLSVSLLAEGVAFRYYAGISDGRLLSLWLENFDVELIKSHFRHKLGTGKWDENLDPGRMIDLVSGYHLTLVDKEKLLSAETFQDILASLKNEPLRAYMAELLPIGGDNAEFRADSAGFQEIAFAWGMVLDRHYFNNLYAAASELGGAEGRMMRMLVGTRVDLLNLYWIYRARRFFKMSPEAALTLVMKARYHADFDLLTRAAFADPAAFSAALAGSSYAGVFEMGNEDAALREIELGRNIHRCFLRAAESVFMSGSLGFQNVAAYLMLKELEVRDLVAVVETVRYGFDRRGAELFLVRPLS